MKKSRQSTEREILREQYMLLAKDSQKCMPQELDDHSDSMVRIYKELSKPHPLGVAVVPCILVYLSLGFLVNYVKYRRQ